jgi:hypothetical protein
MNQPAEILQFSQEEQGRLLARVYAFILSDQFTGNPQEQNTILDTRSTKKSKTQPQGETQVLDAQPVSVLEPTP